MFTLAPIRDVDGTCRFMVGVQVDVTAQEGPITPGEIPQPTQEVADKGAAASAVIGSALKNLGMGNAVDTNPWKELGTSFQEFACVSYCYCLSSCTIVDRNAPPPPPPTVLMQSKECSPHLHHSFPYATCHHTLSSAYPGITE